LYAKKRPKGKTGEMLCVGTAPLKRKKGNQPNAEGENDEKSMHTAKRNLAKSGEGAPPSPPGKHIIGINGRREGNENRADIFLLHGSRDF